MKPGSWVSHDGSRLARKVRRRRMRPYGQERVYGKGLWTARFHYGAKIYSYMPVKNRKRERAIPIKIDE